MNTDTKEPRTVKDCRNEFGRISREAQEQKLITMQDIQTICRPASRKSFYWCRHLHDLRDLVEERKEKPRKSG